MAILLGSLNLAWVAAAAIAALATGTIVRLGTLRGKASDLVTSRLNSLRTWWIVVLVLIGCVWLGPAAVIVLFGVVSGMAFFEFAQLTLPPGGRRPALWAAALIPAQYLWILLGWEAAFAVFVPLAAVLLIAAGQVLAGQTAGYMQTTSRLIWGSLVTIYLLSHAVMLLALPESANPVAGGIGWFLLLLLLTELSDITQALVGRRIGKHKIARRVSPGKTWEGFVGGVLVTMGLAMLLARWFTPLPLGWAALCGLMIAVAGLFGDLNISGIKRDAGVKDSGWLLPGQGGILDRIDSLTFSAPLYYYFVAAFLALQGAGG